MNFIERHTEEDNNNLRKYIIYSEEDLQHSKNVAKDDEIFSFIENNFKRKTIDPLYKHNIIDFGQLTDEIFSKIDSCNQDEKFFKEEYRYNLIKLLMEKVDGYSALKESDGAFYHIRQHELSNNYLEEPSCNKSEIILIIGDRFKVKTLQEFYDNDYIKRIKNTDGFIDFVYKLEKEKYSKNSYKFNIMYINKYMSGYQQIGIDNSGYIATKFTKVLSI